MIETVRDLVDALGGTATTARLVGVGRTAVSNWLRVRRIPAHLYLPFKRECDAQGVEFSEVIFAQLTRAERRSAAE